MTEEQKQQEQSVNLVVPAATLQQVLNYLTGRPYGEVAQLITNLLQSAKPQQQPEQSAE